MPQFIIVTGTPYEGFTPIGPFPSSDVAIKFAEATFEQDDWWLMELEEPESFASQPRGDQK